MVIRWPDGPTKHKVRSESLGGKLDEGWSPRIEEWMRQKPYGARRGMQGSRGLINNKISNEDTNIGEWSERRKKYSLVDCGARGKGKGWHNTWVKEGSLNGWTPNSWEAKLSTSYCQRSRSFVIPSVSLVILKSVFTALSNVFPGSFPPSIC